MKKVSWLEMNTNQQMFLIISLLTLFRISESKLISNIFSILLAFLIQLKKLLRNTTVFLVSLLLKKNSIKHRQENCLLFHMRYSRWYFKSYKKAHSAWKQSVFRVILVHIFSHLDWIQTDTSYPSVFRPNAGKYGPK